MTAYAAWVPDDMDTISALGKADFTEDTDMTNSESATVDSDVANKCSVKA